MIDFMPENKRKLRRYERKMLGSDYPIVLAHYLGEGHHDAGMPKRNPYPSGRRHDEYERGYDLADPMGDHHGRNK